LLDLRIATISFFSSLPPLNFKRFQMLKKRNHGTQLFNHWAHDYPLMTADLIRARPALAAALLARLKIWTPVFAKPKICLT